jgi:TPR repeat protein
MACAQAERLITRAIADVKASEYEPLLRQAYTLLLPLIDVEYPAALYLHGSYTLSLERLDDSAYEKRYTELIQRAANLGHAKAQFVLGQMYDKEGELGDDPEASASWFEKSALQGYAYAQWVHGLNLLTGIGLHRNEALGLDFIRKAAEVDFEGAIEFMIQAHENGEHGFVRDDKAASEWRRRLLDPELIPF